MVRRIPEGQVATYGQVARILDNPRASRAVGFALRALFYRHGDARYDGIPWQRVINREGGISLDGLERVEQAGLLLDEGVAVSPDYFIDLAIYGWEGLLPHEVTAVLKEEEAIYE